MITKDMIQNAWMPGDYTVEVEFVEHKEGEKDGKQWQAIGLGFKIHEPEHLAGRIKPFNLFYGYLVGELIEKGLGRKLDDFFKADGDLDKKKLFEAVDGQFLRVKIGVKNGFNNIAGFIPIESTKAKMDI